MVIGREFGGDGWIVRPKTAGVEAYVAQALIKHRDFFARWMARGQDRGVTFFNFMRALAARCGDGGLIYSNLLCFDSRGKDPSRSEHYPFIKMLSRQLLDLQLDYFRPEVVIFANGTGTVGVRREFYPVDGAGKVCEGLRHWEDQGVSRHHLWHFELLGKHACYRIQHPATRTEQARAARDLLLDLLDTKSGCATHSDGCATA